MDGGTNEPFCSVGSPLVDAAVVASRPASSASAPPSPFIADDNAAANRSREIQVTAGGGGGSPSSPRARRCVPSALFPLRVPRGRVEARERAVSPSLRPRGVSPVGEPRRNSLTLTRRAISRPDRPDTTNSAARVSDGDDVNWLLVFVSTSSQRREPHLRAAIVPGSCGRLKRLTTPSQSRVSAVPSRDGGGGGCRRRGSVELGVCEHGYAFGGGGELGALDGAMRVSPGGVESVADETDVPLGAGGTV